MLEESTLHCHNIVKAGKPRTFHSVCLQAAELREACSDSTSQTHCSVNVTLDNQITAKHRF